MTTNPFANNTKTTKSNCYFDGFSFKEINLILKKKETKTALKNPFDKKDDSAEDINIITSNDPWNVDTSEAQIDSFAMDSSQQDSTNNYLQTSPNSQKDASNSNHQQAIDLQSPESTTTTTTTSNFFEPNHFSQLRNIYDPNNVPVERFIPQQVFQREQIYYTNIQHLGFDPNYVDPDNEPPLLVELGIDVKSIKARALSVLKFKKCDVQLLEDPDMGGPLILCFLFGFFLLFSGKMHFGYIYGFGVSGTLILYCIINFLSMNKDIPLYNTLSILGYCMMPVIILSFFNIFIDLKGFIGAVGGFIAIIWSTVAATNFFVELLSQKNQKYLVAYPIFLFYSVFVLITIF